jgi:two-component system response regulator HydG
LRAALVRLLHAHPADWFDLVQLTSSLARIPLDIENCLRDLVAGGLAEADVARTRFRAKQPEPVLERYALASFLSEPPPESLEEHSTAAQRFRELLGADEKMLLVFESVRLAAKTALSVLVLGPTGSGKELVARTIHQLSARRSKHFQAVNCAALPDTLFESEMFGHEKGAFTGATHAKAGRMELAHAGTLFLDEVGDLSPFSQAKLLRVLEERRLERLGSTRSIEADFRLISATNRPLSDFVRDGRFREDLYYRINAFAIRLPALRERSADIPHLAKRILARYCAMHGLSSDAKVFADSAVTRLMEHSWPGNVRELETTVFRAALSAHAEVIEATDLTFLHEDAEATVLPFVPVEPPITNRGLVTLREAERAHILAVLDAVGGNKKRAARVLSIGRGTLYRKLAEYGTEPLSGAEPSRRRA